MVDKVPGDIVAGDASRGSKIHATQADNSLSRSHLEENISRLQSAANTYSNLLTYDVGDLVEESNVVFRCNTAIVTPEAFTIAKWGTLSQTPWETEIDADSNNITNLGIIGFDNNDGTIRWDANVPQAIEVRVPASDQFRIYMNDVVEYTFGDDILQFHGNDIESVGSITFDSNTSDHLISQNDAVTTLFIEETIGHGFRIDDGNGSISWLLADSGNFSLLEKIILTGANDATFDTDVTIPDTFDTGSTPLVQLNLSQDDSTAIENRPLYRMQNNGSLIYEINHNKTWEFHGDTKFNAESNNFEFQIANTTEMIIGSTAVNFLGNDADNIGTAGISTADITTGNITTGNITTGNITTGNVTTLNIINQGTGDDPILSSDSTTQTLLLTGDFDVSDNSIFNAKVLTFTDNASLLGVDEKFIEGTSDGILLHLPSADEFTISFDGTQHFLFSEDQFVMGDKVIEDTRLIEFTSTLQTGFDDARFVQGDTNGLVLNVPDTLNFRLSIDGTDEYEFSASEADFKDNKIINSRFLSFTSTLESGNESVRYIQGDSLGMVLNVPDTLNFGISIDGNQKFFFDIDTFDVGSTIIDSIKKTIYDVGIISSSASITIDFDTEDLSTLALANDTTFSSSNLGAGKTMEIHITSAASHTLAFPAGWTFYGTKPLATIAGKGSVLQLTSIGSIDADVKAVFIEES